MTQRSEVWNSSIGASFAALCGARHDAANDIAARSAGAVFFTLPPREEAAIEPVPQHVRHELPGLTAPHVQRHAVSDGCADMLPAIERHLNLRYDAPLGHGTAGQVSVGEDLEHGRPEPPEAARALAGARSDRRVEVRGPRAVFGVPRNLHARLHLQKDLMRKQLIVSAEGIEGRLPAAETTRLTARWHYRLRLDAEYAPGAEIGRQAGVEPELREQHMLVAHADIPQAACQAAARPGRPRIRQGNLELVALAERLLIVDLVVDPAGAGGIDLRREDHFALRKRLLRHQGSRHIELAHRPPGLAAQAAQVLDHLIDLPSIEHPFEGRHDLGKAARGTA